MPAGVAAALGTHLGASGQREGAQLRHVDAVELTLVGDRAAEVDVFRRAPAAAVAQDSQDMLKEAATAVDEDAICMRGAAGWCWLRGWRVDRGLGRVC